MPKPDNPLFTNLEAAKQEDVNRYTDSIAEWYDRIMEAGYYDHERVAQGLDNILHGKNKLLELGIGTGLLAQKMIARGYKVTGVDFTPAMLAIARTRLGDAVKLYEQNVAHLDLPESFDAVYSEGGVWVAVRDQEGNLHIESHLPDAQSNLTAMDKMTGVLQNDGLLLLGIQAVQADIEGLSLKNGAVYSQKVQYKLPLIDKEYFVRQAGKVVAHQHSIYRRLTDEEKTTLLNDNHLIDLGVDKSGMFAIFKKAA